MRINKALKQTTVVPKTSNPVSANTYNKSAEYIRAAIDELGKTARSDPKAREAIANLGVILLDLN